MDIKTPATPVVATVEIDGYTVTVHAATYRQFMRAANAASQMEGTADLCDATCIVEGHDDPASEILSVNGVSRAVALAIGADKGDGADPL
jgi:hypothetical protein